MGGINFNNKKLLKLWAWIDTFSVPWFLTWGQDLLILLLFTSVTFEREWITMDYFSNTYKKEQSCNLTYVSLFYHYYNRFFLNDISELIPESHVFLCNIRLSRQADPYVVDWPVDRTIPCWPNSLFSRIICMWNYLGADVVPFWI